MDARLVSFSKFLSLVLRHRPEHIGIELDTEGWTDVSVLIERARASGTMLDRATLLAVVADNDKKRFTLSGDGQRIRAAQGHSTATVAMTREAATPPATLYHGTPERFVEPILRDGLSPGERHHVHLSPDVDTARTVAARRGRPVVLAVDAGAMRAAGHVFHQADNGVWLTAAVPPRFLRVVESRR